MSQKKTRKKKTSKNPFHKTIAENVYISVKMQASMFSNSKDPHKFIQKSHKPTQR